MSAPEPGPIAQNVCVPYEQVVAVQPLPLCTRQGCHEVALWQPVLWVPVRAAEKSVLRIVLPIQVCSDHKIPKYGWTGLSDPGIIETIQNKHEDAVLERAWITHDHIGLVPDTN